MVFDESRHETYQLLLNKNGETKQVLKAIEEMNELSHALARELQKSKFDREKQVEYAVVTEIADALMMVEQLVYIYDLDVEDIELDIKRKLSKLKKSLRGGT